MFCLVIFFFTLIVSFSRLYFVCRISFGKHKCARSFSLLMCMYCSLSLSLSFCVRTLQIRFKKTFLYAFRFVVYSLSLPLFNFNIYFGCLHIQNLWMCSIYIYIYAMSRRGGSVCVCMHIFVISRILELRLLLFTFWGRTFYVPCTQTTYYS